MMMTTVIQTVMMIMTHDYADDKDDVKMPMTILYYFL